MLKCCFILILLPFVEGIFGGVPVTEAEEFPFLARITAYGIGTYHICVGTILSEELILTSGHCTMREIKTFFPFLHTHV